MIRFFAAAVLMSAFLSSSASAQTAFNYQGFLRTNGQPLSGAVSLSFKLFDAATGGTQIGTTQNTNLSVQSGAFSAALDFGANAFPSAKRWLEIAVNGTILTPRSEITPAPYAMGLRLPLQASVSYEGNAFSVTNDKPYFPGVHGKSTANNQGIGVFGESLKGTGVQGFSDSGYGVYGYSKDFVGVFGYSLTSSGVYGYGYQSATGVYGFSDFSSGIKGILNNTTGLSPNWSTPAILGETNVGNGVAGLASLANAAGVIGYNPNGYGVYGTGFTGVYGNASGTTGAGVWGETSVAGGTGVYGNVSGANAYGVWGRSDNGYAVYGYSANSKPILGVRGAYSGLNTGIFSTPAIHGETNNGNGVMGVTSTNGGAGVLGYANTYGVYGYANFIGVNAYSAGHGVWAESTATADVYMGVLAKSASTSGTGVWGEVGAGSGVTTGVYGKTISPSGRGVFGYNLATTGTGRGVLGRSDSSGGVGVHGWAAASSGLVYGVYGQAQSNGYGVFASGSMGASGTKSFVIDHPLDPANKFLRHYSAEGPEPLNLYCGNATLDANGEAWVELPSYFEEINKDFRYQLTAIGAPGRDLYIAREISENRFQIAGGKPGMKVSWEVKGVRNDRWVRLNGAPVETDKPEEMRGKLLQPELYGESRESALFPADAPAEPAQTPPQR